jgi:hypothetical protein
MSQYKRIWQKLPRKHTDNGKIINPDSLILGLSSILLEWKLGDNCDESVRSHEYPVLRRIEDGIINNIFIEEDLRDVKKLLEKYVAYGDDIEATDIACKILGKTPDELGAGSMAATQVLSEIATYGDSFEKKL